MLTLVPCHHFWLEVKATPTGVIALCKYRGCQKRREFSMDEWNALAVEGRALNKPTRV